MLLIKSCWFSVAGGMAVVELMGYHVLIQDGVGDSWKGLKSMVVVEVRQV